MTDEPSEDTLWTSLCHAAFLVLLLMIVIKVIVHCYFRRLLLDGLPSRHVFITGCDMGFGHRLAKRLDGQGVHVYAACLTKEGMKGLEECCSTRLTTIQVDVRNTEDIKRAYDIVREKLPQGTGLWGVVNNAGVMDAPGPATWYDRKDFVRMFDINTLGMIDVSLQFLPLLKQSRGRLVLTSSIIGRVAIPAQSLYCASKFAIAGFTDSIRSELKSFGVKVVGIQPGGHKTNLTDHKGVSNAAQKAWDRLPEHMQHQYGEKYLNDLMISGHFLIDWACSSNLDAVVDAYYMALFARHPKAVYVVGLDAYVYIFLSYLPLWITDWSAYLLGMKPANPPA